MSAHDPYMVKAIEYLVAVATVALFALFWRYVHGAQPQAVAAEARDWAGAFSDWFRLPDRLFFHHGHAWAKPGETGVMTIGVDDFAQHLVGPVDAVDLPALGTELRAGAPAWALKADGRSIDMLSPVTGTVVGLNPFIRKRAGLVNEDPYGTGWLLKIEPRVPSALKDLMTGVTARRWIDRVSNDLFHSMTPELGHVAQDGGLPVHGIARAIDEAHWDAVARKFLLTDGGSHEQQRS
jgi:glycine cleavage system H lipoate-binding protein